VLEGVRRGFIHGQFARQPVVLFGAELRHCLASKLCDCCQVLDAPMKAAPIIRLVRHRCLCVSPLQPSSRQKEAMASSTVSYTSNIVLRPVIARRLPISGLKAASLSPPPLLAALLLAARRARIPALLRNGTPLRSRTNL